MLYVIALVAIGFFVADWRVNRYAANRSSGYSQSRAFLASPMHITVFVFLVLHFCLHIFWLMVSSPDTGTLYWHTPVIASITLANVQRAVLTGLIALVAVEFWFRESNARCCFAADSLVAASEVGFLVFSIYTIPQSEG